MFVRIGQHLTRPAEMTRGGGEPALMLQFGSTVDFRLARMIELLLRDLITPEAAFDAAKAQWNKAPLTYDETAMLVGCPRRFLVGKVREDPTFPCLDFGARKVFLGHHVEEIQQRFERGDLRYVRKGPRA